MSINMARVKILHSISYAILISIFYELLKFMFNKIDCIQTGKTNAAAFLTCMKLLWRRTPSCSCLRMHTINPLWTVPISSLYVLVCILFFNILFTSEYHHQPIKSNLQQDIDTKGDCWKLQRYHVILAKWICSKYINLGFDSKPLELWI